MEVSLQQFNPPPTVINVIQGGKIIDTLQLKSMSLKDQVWINKEFSDNEDQNNGLDVLNIRLATQTDIDALFTVIFKLLIGGYKSFNKFYNKFVDVPSIVPTFYQALNDVMEVSQPVLYDLEESGQKKSL